MMKWTAEELNTLKSLLAVEGIELDILSQKIPSRSTEAIYRKATTFNYGIKTGRDGISRLYFGKRPRTTYKNKIVSEPRTVSAVQEPTKQLESVQDFSNDIIADKNVCPLINGLEANSRAVNLLKEANLIIEPSIVCQLSLHIIKCQRE